MARKVLIQTGKGRGSLGSVSFGLEGARAEQGFSRMDTISLKMVGDGQRLSHSIVKGTSLVRVGRTQSKKGQAGLVVTVWSRNGRNWSGLFRFGLGRFNACRGGKGRSNWL